MDFGKRLWGEYDSVRKYLFSISLFSFHLHSEFCIVRSASILSADSKKENAHRCVALKKVRKEWVCLLVRVTCRTESTQCQHGFVDMSTVIWIRFYVLQFLCSLTMAATTFFYLSLHSANVFESCRCLSHAILHAFPSKTIGCIFSCPYAICEIVRCRNSQKPMKVMRRKRFAQTIHLSSFDCSPSLNLSIEWAQVYSVALFSLLYFCQCISLPCSTVDAVTSGAIRKVHCKCMQNVWKIIFSNEDNRLFCIRLKVVEQTVATL